MSLLTVFGTIEFDDAKALRDWSGAHALRHMTIDREMARQGKAVSTVSTFGELDEDWFGRHWLKHVALNQVPNGATATSSFERRWKNRNEFYTWHQAHNRAHVNIEHALGITTG